MEVVVVPGRCRWGAGDQIINIVPISAVYVICYGHHSTYIISFDEFIIALGRRYTCASYSSRCRFGSRWGAQKGSTFEAVFGYRYLQPKVR